MMNSTLTIAPATLVQEHQAEQLGARAKLGQEPLTDAKRKELKKISQDFESLFVGMMLKSMRATVPEDTLTGGGRAEETYRSLLDQEYATAATRRGGVGIASMVEQELLRRYEGPPVPTKRTTLGDEQ
ncbi:MAG: rod-binding protein [Trichlorobacter sp.]|jgi:flagellar protein FlgJ